MNIFKKMRLLEIGTMLFFVLDRILKQWALSLNKAEIHSFSGNSATGISYMPEIYFKLVFNRGVSWGVLNSNQSLIFICVSLMVGTVTFWLLNHIIFKYKAGLSIFPECLVFLGSLSNIIDRFLYKGVIDFIVVDFGPWIFPIFNLADCAIVFGIFLMAINQLFSNRDQIIGLEKC